MYVLLSAQIQLQGSTNSNQNYCGRAGRKAQAPSDFHTAAAPAAPDDKHLHTQAASRPAFFCLQNRPGLHAYGQLYMHLFYFNMKAIVIAT